MRLPVPMVYTALFVALRLLFDGFKTCGCSPWTAHCAAEGGGHAPSLCAALPCLSCSGGF